MYEWGWWESKGRHQCAHWCKKVSGGHFFSPWEIPLISERSPSGLWAGINYRGSVPLRISSTKNICYVVYRHDISTLGKHPGWFWLYPTNKSIKTPVPGIHFCPFCFTSETGVSLLKHKSATAFRYFFELPAMPTLSDIYISKLRATASANSAILPSIPPPTSVPTVASSISSLRFYKRSTCSSVPLH